MKHLILFLLALCATPAFAACHAVGPATTGTASGADWNNVMRLPTAPVRGDIYYLKDGSYGSYSPTTATSGTTRITIKKAQSYDFGRTTDGCPNDISAGWNPATMGASQAVFAAVAGSFSTSGGQGFYTLDGNGQTGTAGCGVSPAVNAAASDCGIKLSASGTSASTYGVLWINGNYDAGATRATGWIVRYLEIAGAGDAGNNIVNSNEHTFYCRNGCNNLLFEHNYMHDSACDFIDTPYGATATFNLNHFKQNASSANCHGQFWLGDGNQNDSYTFSNNLIQEIQGTAYWSILNGGQASNWNIFNNVIFQTSGSTRPGVSTGTFVVVNTGSFATGINIIDNTWINNHTDYNGHYALACDGNCTGTIAFQGNLMYGIVDDQGGGNPISGSAFTNTTDSYNSFLNSGPTGITGTGDITVTSGAANPFVNWPSLNFNLTSNGTNVNSALSLSSPFNVDAAGNPRPSGGTWNRGAIQLASAVLQSITLLPPVNGYNLTSNTGTVQLTAACYSAPGVTMTCPALTWGSNNTSQIAVSSSGLVTGAGGSTCVTPEAYAYSGQIIGHARILIDCSTISSIASRPGPFSGVTSSHVVVGTTILLSAVDNNNNPMGDYVAWTTSDATKATVNSIGEVTGIAVGTATITATIAGQSIGRTINVTNPSTALNTYYVRPGGGNRSQSTGLCDVDYPGSGTGTCSAVNEIMYCFTDESSSTAYTGLVQAGDTCRVHPGKVYTVGNKNFSTAWISASGGLGMPSGTPANKTKLIADCSPSCSTDPDNAGNRVLINTFGSGNANVLFDTQNTIMDGFDITSGEDCNHTLSNGVIPFACPTGHAAFWVLSDQFTANVTFSNVRVHGMNTNWLGTPGPGVVFNNVSAQMGWLAGINFDNGFGENGNRTDGFTGNGLSASYSGGTESQPKTLTGVSRDGAGNLNVTFAAGQVVNYAVGTNLVLAGMTPSDLNGTFPVSAITFNQQAVTITGATCTEPNTGTQPSQCVFTTTSTPAFGIGAFVQLAGTFSPSLNTGIDKYEVISTGTNQFAVVASSITRPNWPVGPTPITVTCTGTCTAKTANALVATASGASESASVVGTASFVHPVHRMCDQGTSNSCNGDGVGSGNNTIGTWFCDHCAFRDNAQDGWDMLHSVMVKSSLTNSIGVGNEGAPAKLGNADVVNMWNDELLATCSVMLAPDPNKPPDYNQYLALPCRANASFGLFSRMWSRMTLSNITWGPGNQNGIWDDNCSDTNCDPAHALPMASYIAQNTLYLGFNDTNNPGWDGSVPFIYLGDQGTTFPAWTWLNNAGFNVRNPPAGGSSNQWTLGACPTTLCVPDINTFANESQAMNWNVNITTSSTAYHAGVVNAFTPATDINGVSRASVTSIGALEPLGAPPTLASIAVTPNPGAVVVSSTLAMTCTATFSDSSTAPCTSPVWTDTAVHSSINSSTGVVTGVSAGADTITATIGSISGNATVNVSGLPVVATPTASPVAGTYTSTQSVTLSTATGGATICYTTNGSTPAATTPGTCDAGSTTYSGAITVATTTTIKAIGTLSGDTNSSVATFVYTITIPTVATPTTSPAAGTYTSTQSVTLSDATSGAAICFTTDGTTPTAPVAGTCSGGTTQTFSTAISVASTTTIKALGTKAANTNSGVASFLYTITPPVIPAVSFSGTGVNFSGTGQIQH